VQLEPQRERLALHALGLAGIETYAPRLRELLRRARPRGGPDAAAFPGLPVCCEAKKGLRKRRRAMLDKLTDELLSAGRAENVITLDLNYRSTHFAIIR
jgi:hypothetical protein